MDSQATIGLSARLQYLGLCTEVELALSWALRSDVCPHAPLPWGPRGHWTCPLRDFNDADSSLTGVCSSLRAHRRVRLHDKRHHFRRDRHRGRSRCDALGVFGTILPEKFVTFPDQALKKWSRYLQTRRSGHRSGICGRARLVLPFDGCPFCFSKANPTHTFVRGAVWQ